MPLSGPETGYVRDRKSLSLCSGSPHFGDRDGPVALPLHNSRRNALPKPGAIGDEAARMRQIKMPAAAAGLRFHGVGQRPPFQFLKRVVAPVLGIDVEHNQIGDLAGDDADIGVGPVREPSRQGRRVGARLLQCVPAGQWPFVAAPQRQHRPAAGEIADSGLRDRRLLRWTVCAIALAPGHLMKE